MLFLYVNICLSENKCLNAFNTEPENVLVKSKLTDKEL